MSSYAWVSLAMTAMVQMTAMDRTSPLVRILAPSSAGGNSIAILPNFHTVVLGVAGPQRPLVIPLLPTLPVLVDTVTQS